MKERRKSPRRPLMESFGFFAIVPAKGMYRLPVHDLSETGISLDIDVDGEGQDFPVKEGEALVFHLYLNQSLYLSLKGKVAWIRTVDGKRTAGAEFSDKKEAGFKAVSKFVKVLDVLHESATLDPAQSGN